jgi:MFS family permease
LADAGDRIFWNETLNALNTLNAPEAHSRYLIPALLLGNFVIGTGAMMIAGMLNQLSAEFKLPPPQVAQLLSVFAIVCGVGAPLLAIGLATKGRRAVLTGSLLVYALCHALAVITQSFTVLLIVRAFTAIGAAIFTPPSRCHSEHAHRARAARKSGGFNFSRLGFGIGGGFAAGQLFGGHLPLACCYGFGCGIVGHCRCCGMVDCA